MSNTMIKLNRYKTLSQAKSRLSHNRRKKSFDEKKMLNINEVLKDIKVDDTNQTKLLSKTEITNKISKLNYRLKQYTKQRDNLYGHKFVKKQKQILKLERDISSLKIQRDKTASQMNYAKKAYVEFVLTITKTPNVYKKDIEFANELKRVSMLFLKNRFTTDIYNIDIHLDQSTPHLHVMSRYIGNNSLQKDLDKNYSKKRYQYSDMQIEFNNFIKDSFDFKKFPKLTIEDITKGGKRDYLPLSEYKELNSEINKKVQKEINAILKNIQVTTKLFDEDQIKESDYDNLLKKYKIVKMHYYFLKKLTDKNEARKILDDLKKKNEDLHQELELLKRQNNKSKQYEETIKEIFGEEIINLSSIDYNLTIQEQKINILTLSKHKKALISNLQQTKQELIQIKNRVKKYEHTISHLENEITTRDTYITRLKELIFKSKIPTLINALKSIGENISSYKNNILRNNDRNIDR
jgi:hypothetical protein